MILFALAECNFEENHLCGFMNRWNPNVNWFVGGGNIGNSQPILPRDHTLNDEFGKQERREVGRNLSLVNHNVHCFHFHLLLPLFVGLCSEHFFTWMH